MTPELPSPVALGVGYFDEHIFGHTKEQLIEYGKLVEAATREECAMVCDVTPPQPFRPSIEAAHAIRSMK